jgi:hypothetical protein
MDVFLSETDSVAGFVEDECELMLRVNAFLLPCTNHIKLGVRKAASRIYIVKSNFLSVFRSFTLNLAKVVIIKDPNIGWG